MTNFKVGNFVFEYSDIAKHHPVIPLRIGRTLPDGTYTDLIVSEDLRKAVESTPENVFEVTKHIYHNKKMELVKEKFVKLENTEYQTSNIDYYSFGAMNTKQRFVIRLHFKFEHAYAALIYEFNSSGSYAMGFSSMVDSALDYAIEEGISNPFEKSGIRKGDSADYAIFAVDMNEGFADEIEVTDHDLESSLIGVELLHFESEIVTDEKELEAL